MEYGPTFRNEFAEMQTAVHENAKAHGWWEDGDRNDGECIALMHSELSEALEALRAGNPPNDKGLESRHWPPAPAGDLHAESVPLSSVEEELADVVIRIMDYAERRGFDVATAIVKKHAYNKGRPHKHGGKLF